MERSFLTPLDVRDLDTQYNIQLAGRPAYATVGGVRPRPIGLHSKGRESLIWQFSLLGREMDGSRVRG